MLISVEPEYWAFLSRTIVALLSLPADATAQPKFPSFDAHTSMSPHPVVSDACPLRSLVLVAAVVMIVLIVLFYCKQQNGRIYILVVHYTGDSAGDNVIRALGKIKYFVKSKTLRKDKTEMAIEVFCKNNDTFFMEKIRAVDGVIDSTLIQYNGEYHGSQKNNEIYFFSTYLVPRNEVLK